MHKAHKKQRNKDLQPTCSTRKNTHLRVIYKICFQRFDFLFLCTIIILTLRAITIMYVVKYQIFLFFPYFQVEHFTRYGMHEYLDDEQLAKKLKRPPLKPHLQVHRFTFCVVKVKLSFCIIKFTIKYKVLCGSTAEEVSFEWSHHRISSTDSKVRTT